MQAQWPYRCYEERTMDESERRARLIGWLDKIPSDVEDLLLDDHIFWELQNIVDGHSHFASSSGLFTQWTASAFAQATAVGIRRQAKCDEHSASLKRFLREVQKYPCLVSRVHYLGLFQGKDQDCIQAAHEEFDEIGGVDADNISSTTIVGHLDELERGVNRIEHYVDRRIAHYDSRGLSRPEPKYGDLSDGLKSLERIVLFYKQFLQGAGMTSLLPMISFDWQDVFRFAWISPNDEQTLL